jgi:hypothetical protein
MDPEDIADEAVGDEGGNGLSSATTKPRSNPELVALMKRFGRAIDARDWEGAAKAFEESHEACAADYDAG